MMNAYDVLKSRGFVEQVTDEEGVRDHLQEPRTVYCGFDPTADSLHIGNLVPIMGLKHLQLAGHRIIALVGGATGMIGDPSGKEKEREFLDEATLERNVAGIAREFDKILDIDGSDRGLVVNNYDWIKGMTYIQWLRDVGKSFSVNVMVNKESVRRRLEDRDQGISYTEFSYMLLQAYDFAHLQKSEGCLLQVGGSDQWGNITAGIDLIRRRTGQQAYGITFQLITTASGKKFGKSEGGAIWVDSERTSVWDYYQYWIRTEDADVERFLKLFTLLPLEEIAQIMETFRQDPGSRLAQKKLAFEATALMHGKDQAEKMQRGAEALYAGRLAELERDLIQQVFGEGPILDVSAKDLSDGLDLIEQFLRAGLVKSKGEARRMLKQGALYVNDSRVEPGQEQLGEDQLLPSKTIVLRRGKKDVRLLRIHEDR